MLSFCTNCCLNYVHETSFREAKVSVDSSLLRYNISIHVIFSWAQIGRSAIFGREIGVPDREIFSRQKKKSSLMSKIIYLHQRRSL